MQSYLAGVAPGFRTFCMALRQTTTHLQWYRAVVMLLMFGIYVYKMHKTTKVIVQQDKKEDAGGKSERRIKRL